jgi:beta-glucanase (GH16 family)
MIRRRPLAAVLAVVLCAPLTAACTAGGDDAVARPSAAPSPAGSDGGSGHGAGAPPLPVGARGGWELAFSDEFDGAALDRSRWADRSTAEPDMGHGNQGNQQLEWNRAANCEVTGGELVMTARREPFTSPSGIRYDWTSCLITSSPSYSFRYGYLEERSILPAERGFWPAFWTWQTRGVDRHTETDVYEYYSDNPHRLYGTQYSGPQGRCTWQPAFDPAGGWHTYGVAIEPSGTTWYADGVEVCHTGATSDAPTDIISNLAVYSEIPPEAGTTRAVKRVDYIRAWQAS